LRYGKRAIKIGDKPWDKGWVAYEFREGEVGMEALCILATNGAQISEH